jgi:hypothetical protein
VTSAGYASAVPPASRIAATTAGAGARSLTAHDVTDRGQGARDVRAETAAGAGDERDHYQLVGLVGW